MEWLFGSPDADQPRGLRSGSAPRGGRGSIRARKSRFSGEYNVYDEQNEIRGAEMREKYRQMHSGDHDAAAERAAAALMDDDLDVRPPEFVRDNPMDIDDDSKRPSGKRKKKAKNRFKQAAREAAEGGLRETIGASGASTTVRGGDDEDADEETTRLTSTSRFGALRKLIRKRSSLTSTFLEHATDANILKVYNKWVAHPRSDGLGDQQFSR